MRLKRLRSEVLRRAQQMVSDDLAHGSAGNVSARDPQSGLITITPSGIEYGEMQLEDIVIVDGEGQPVEGNQSPTSEWRMHITVYRARPDIGGLVHTHPPHATLFAALEQPIPMVVDEAAYFLGGPVPVAAYAPPGTQSLADSVRQALGQGLTVLLARHGLLTAGADLAQAYQLTLAAEFSARLAILARSIGVDLKPLDPDHVAELHAAFRARRSGAEGA